MSTSLDALVVYTGSVIDSESNILYTITVLGNLGVLLLVEAEGRFESVDDVTVLDNVSAGVSVTGLESLKAF